MKKLLFSSLLLCPLAFFSLAAVAQTTVTATVVDPNTNPYANGTVSAQLAVSIGQASRSTTPSALDGTGFFSISLANGTYTFTVCAAPVNIGPLGNRTPQQVCFVSAPIVLSGGSVDVSATLNALAPIIGPRASGTGTPGGTPGQIQINNAGAFGGITLLSIANGGTGTASPGLIPGTNISITGIWPNQTITSTGSTVCSGSVALGTSLIASGAPATTVIATCTGLLSTDNLIVDFNGSPLAVTGYIPSASGILTIIKWPSVNQVNIAVVNDTASGITPGAITVNYRGIR